LYTSNHTTDAKATPVHSRKFVRLIVARPKIVRMKGTRCSTVRNKTEVDNTQGARLFF